MKGRMPIDISGLQSLDPTIGIPLLVVLTSATLGAVVLLGLALVALVERKSRPYLLLALAVTALLARSVVAGLSMAHFLPEPHHHLLEHTFDVAMAAFVIGAVYYARTVDRRLDQARDG